MRGCQFFDETIVFKFLEAHATIEHLMYYPIRLETSLSPGSLPALKVVTSAHDFTMRILRDTTVCSRTMEGIGQICLGPNTMRDLEMIDGSELRSLHIWKYDDIQMVHQIAKLFPNITVLEMPRFGVPRGEMDESIVGPSFLVAFHSESHEAPSIQDDYICTLSCFPQLEVLLYTNVWGTIQAIQDRIPKEAAILKFAQACPNLKRVEYHDLTSSTRVYVDIATRK
jgi:hypothetical protein